MGDTGLHVCGFIIIHFILFISMFSIEGEIDGGRHFMELDSDKSCEGSFMNVVVYCAHCLS